MKLIACCPEGQYHEAAAAAFGGSKFCRCDHWRESLQHVVPPFLFLIHETDAGRWKEFSEALLERIGRNVGWAVVRYSIGGPHALPREVPHPRFAVLRSDISSFLALVGQSGTAEFMATLADGRTDFSLLCKRVPHYDDDERKLPQATLSGWITDVEYEQPISDDVLPNVKRALEQVVKWIEPGAQVPALDLDSAKTWFERLTTHPILYYENMAHD
ncbi:hypothetical protein ABT392_07855 [Paucibacter sp. JuS9]|uniref:hypothetical protein n=1 Tax=Paucibacter sp. JuS9 TaxID=3228748 RepID=UPI003757A50F